MWKFLLLAGCVSVVSAAPVPKELKKPSDKDRIVGTWTAERISVGGQPWDASFILHTITFATDGTARFQYKGSPDNPRTWEIDPTGTPKRMVWKPGKVGDLAYNCAYDFTPDRLVIAIGHHGKPLPTAAEPGPNVTIYEFKRADAK